MIILHVDCSPRLPSHSRLLSAAVVRALLTTFPDAQVCRRDLGCEPIPHTRAAYASALATPASLAEAGRSADAVLPAEELIQEVERSDVIVLGTPMNNFSIPSVLKAWIDQLLRVGRTMQSTPTGKVGMLRDRPVIVGIASGGVFTGDGANQPDYLTPYLTTVFGCVGLKSIQFLALQGTAFIDDARATETRDSLVASVQPALMRLMGSAREDSRSL